MKKMVDLLGTKNPDRVADFKKVILTNYYYNYYYYCS